MNKILKSGWLSFPPHVNSICSGKIKIDSFKDNKINEMFNPDCVCFADIPKSELQIHISKYSKFGMAFKKSFLTDKGANPVFYIENNSSICDFSSPEEHKSTNRVDYYQEFCSNGPRIKLTHKFIQKSHHYWWLFFWLISQHVDGDILPANE